MEKVLNSIVLEQNIIEIENGRKEFVGFCTIARNSPENNRDRIIILDQNGRYVVVDAPLLQGGKEALSRTVDLLNRKQPLKVCMDEAHHQIHSLYMGEEGLELSSQDSSVENRAGTVLVSAQVFPREQKVFIRGVGDCRALLVRGSTIIKFTYPENVAGISWRSGSFSENQARRKVNLLNILGPRNKLGISEGYEAFEEKWSYQPGDVLVLLTDGAWGGSKNSDTNIARIVGEAANVTEAAEKIVETGHNQTRDDATAIVVQL